MTQYYVVRGSVSRPSLDVQTFWEHNPVAWKSLVDKIRTFSVKNETLAIRNEGRDIDWQICFADELQYQNFINECRSGVLSLEINLRKEYEASVGIVRTSAIIGYIDIPE